MFRVDILNTAGNFDDAVGSILLDVFCHFSALLTHELVWGLGQQWWGWRSPSCRPCYGPVGARAGCPGRSNPTSTECTTSVKPQAWLFPIFPWTAFAFIGLAVGLFLVSDWAKKNGAAAIALGALGGLLIYLAKWLDARPEQLYAVYDFWHTSPNFFLIRVGLLLLIMAAAYAWCRWGAGQWGFSPLIQLGQTSLLVYWVHIEFVYGRFSILHKRAQDIPMASLGLLVIFLSMVLLSVLRTNWKGSSTNPTK